MVPLEDPPPPPPLDEEDAGAVTVTGLEVVEDDPNISVTVKITVYPPADA